MPAAAYVCVVVGPVPVVPSPKLHEKPVTVPSRSLEALPLKVTGAPVGWGLGVAVKDAVGATSFAVSARFWVAHCASCIAVPGPLTWLEPHTTLALVGSMLAPA